MTVVAWRFVRSDRAMQPFSGRGASLRGGRWNPIGRPAVYVASSQALAILEILANVESSDWAQDYLYYEVRFDDRFVTDLKSANLPANWRDHPAPLPLPELGGQWLNSGRSAVLAVPSALVPSEGNYMLNPEHPDFQHIAIGAPTAFRLDPRLL